MFLVSNIVWDSASADSQIALFRSPAHIPISKYLCPGSDLILSKKTGGTEVSLQGLETFTSYYIKVAAFTRAGQGKASKDIYCRTAEDGKYKKGWSKIQPISRAATFESMPLHP